MRHTPDGKRIIASLANGLPVTTWVAVTRAIEGALQKEGYTDVVLLGDGRDAGYIAATPPHADWEPPEGEPTERRDQLSQLLSDLVSADAPDYWPDTDPWADRVLAWLAGGDQE